MDFRPGGVRNSLCGISRGVRLAAALSVAGAAGARAAEAPAMIYPSAERLAALYPKIATNFGLHGEVMLRCRIVSGDRLDCRVEREAPAGFGFGRAALAIAAETRAKLKDPPPEGIGLPINFEPEVSDGALKAPSDDCVGVFEAIIGAGRFFDPTLIGDPEAAFRELDPPVRAAAEAAYAELKTELPHLVARILGRQGDRVIAASDAARLNRFLHSADGVYLLRAYAEDKPPSPEWLAGGDREEMVRLLLQVIEGAMPKSKAAEDELVEELASEVSEPFRRRLCARVTCLPIDRVQSRAAAK
jgi:hypothetical protein